MPAKKKNATKRKHAGNLTLLGGWLCLDFVNTVEWWGKKGPLEYLKTYHDLIVCEMPPSTIRVVPVIYFDRRS